ncbi:MAG: hypothetical protein U5K31_00320 [Balneolaceae bacterium]|nr:hypothetical protein [Balneolaceae bacterium]
MKRILSSTLGIFLTAGMLILAGCSGSSSEQQAAEDTMTADSEAMASADSAWAPTQKLNLNTASGEDFGTIPGVGENMIHEFEEYRPYVSISQFRQEIGKYVDSTQVATYEGYVFVPVQRNDSDAATLMQIPGLDADEAESLIGARPFESNEAFLQALSEYVSEEQMAAAEHFLQSGSQ